MKFFFLQFLFVLTFSGGNFASARGPGDSPTPFPLGQAPEDMVGNWNNIEKDETIAIIFIQNGRIERPKLLATVYTDGKESSQGYLIFNDERYCGVMRKTRGGKYNLCVWKEHGFLKTATYIDDEWGSSLSYK